MICRENCGACCIALSISSPIPGMPDGKPAGVRCIHLLDDYKCAIYNNGKPRVCEEFTAEEDFCGTNQMEAMKILGSLSIISPKNKPPFPP
jgi:Fe-S-cluster containining protein